jgi:hypothetical protein
MADGTPDSWEMIERWRAEHPEFSGGPAAPPPPTRRLVPVPTPDPKVAAADQRAMIERWRQDHPHVGTPTALEAQRVAAERNRVAVDDRETFDLDATPLTVLGAFIVGCIFGGIVMVIITGIAFWGFAGG